MLLHQEGSSGSSDSSGSSGSSSSIISGSIIDEDGKEDVSSSRSDIIEKIQQVIVLIPHKVEVLLPKVEIDIINADKSKSSQHNSLHFIIGGSVTFSVFLLHSIMIVVLLLRCLLHKAEGIAFVYGYSHSPVLLRELRRHSYWFYAWVERNDEQV